MRLASVTYSNILLLGFISAPFALSLRLQPNVSRRNLLLTSSAALTLASPSPASAISTEPLIPGSSSPLSPGGVARYKPQSVGEWNDADDQHIFTKLGRTRLLANELSPLQQPLFGGEQELYYAPFMFGAWNVKATLMRKIYPYSTDCLTSRSLEEGSPRNREEKVGNTCEYKVHYFSTLANTLANKITVNLGTGVPATKIIQDRAYNIISLSNAYQQLAPVQEVEWDYSKDPTSLKLNFGAGPLGPDMRPLGQRRGEVFIQARQAETYSDDIFCVSERSRSLTVAFRDALVSDTETITEFTRVSPTHVRGISRTAVYLTPNPNSREGILWQQTGGKAVAFFDYALEMEQFLEEFTNADGSIVKRACVKTPKDIVQCY